MPASEPAAYGRLTDALLRQARWATQPLVPESALRSAQASLDQPRLDDWAWRAKGRGFVAGSLEGLRDLTSPLGLASLAVPALRSAKPAAKVAAKVADVSPEVLAALDARLTGLVPKPAPLGSLQELAKEDAFRRGLKRLLQ